MADSRTYVRLLVGIGLVLVGLLAGILGMLVLDNESEEPSVARIVHSADAPARAGTTQTAGVSAAGVEEGPDPSTLNSLFSRVARSVRPGVVSIYVESEGQGGEFSGELPFDVPAQNLGSGVIISPDGYVVTNNHVVRDAEQIRVRLADKRQYEARIVGTDRSTDLAVIKIDGSADFPVVPIGRSKDVQVGDWVVAIGNPFQLTSTVTAGIVSALGRQLQIIEDQFRIENFIQTDAAINPGNSGGALVNLQGELVGINTAIASQSQQSEGYGFAIPSALVERIATDLIAHGEVRRGYLGVSILPVDDQMARKLGLSEIRGVYIEGVRRGSAAAEAGLESGDVVLSVTGEAVDAPNDLQTLVAQRRPGDEITLRVWRDGDVQTLDATLMGENTSVYENWLSDLRSSPSQGRDPSGQPSPPSDNDETGVTEIEGWGVGLRPFKESDSAVYDVEAGAFVAYVESGGRAAAAGLPRGVVITHLDGAPVKGPSDVVRYLTSTSGSVLVRVQRRDGTPAFYEIN